MRKCISLMIVLLLLNVAVFAQEDETSLPDAWMSLSSVGQEATIVLTELEDDGLIPSGATALFSQSRLSYAGEGVQFSNFGIGTEAMNLLYSATLDFQPQSENLEFCGIAARTVREESNRQEGSRSLTTIRLSAYLMIGLDNRGNLFVADNQSEDSSATTVPLPDGMIGRIQLTALIMNNLLYVYANNILLIEGLEITEGAGAFAFVYNSSAEETSCLGEMLFAYTFPDVIEMTCTISPIEVANKRQAATVDAQVIGQLLAGDSIEATGQMQGSDGYTWWQLNDGTWVRDDVVLTAGFCRALPNVLN
jgi:hypothetical protein